MKKTFILILLMSLISGLFVNFLPAKSAYAEVSYLRIINENTPFYSKSTDSKPLFFLPYTYYVKVLETGADYTHVECKPSGNAPAIDGYVPSDMLFSDGLTVTEPYVNVNVKTATTALLFSDYSLSTPLQYVFPEREMNYYGKYVNESGYIVYFVNYNNRLGYVKESDIYPFSFSNHPNELTFIKQDSPLVENQQATNTPSSNVDTTFSIKIIIIACLIFSGIVGLIFAIKHKPAQSSAVTFYDENDYE